MHQRYGIGNFVADDIGMLRRKHAARAGVFWYLMSRVIIQEIEFHHLRNCD